MANLLPHHLTMLTQESAIKPDVITARPYLSVTKKDCPKYGFVGKQSNDGLVYQIHTPDNIPNLWGLRPDKPRLSKTGRAVKYEHPFGHAPRLDIPVDVHPFIPDPKIDVIITEGTKKVDSILSNLSGDYLLLNLCNGVYGWLQNKRVIPDVDLIAWDTRHAYLLFDNDVSVKPPVRYALSWLSEELAKRKANTSIVYLPENRGKKLGVDDYFGNGGTSASLLEFMRLSRIDIMAFIDEVAQAKGNARYFDLFTRLIWRLADIENVIELRVYAEEIKDKGIIGITQLMGVIKERQEQLAQKSPTDDELRDMFIEKAPPTAYGLEEWRRYENGIWPAVNAAVIKDEIEQVIESTKVLGILPDSKLLNSVTTLAQVKLYEIDDKWDAEANYLACKNGVLHLPTRVLLPHDPDLYLTSGVDYDFDPKAQAPNWKSFLYDLVLSIGQDVVDFLQEYLGYSLTPDCSYELGVWLHGPPGSGKSTLIEGTQETLGKGRAGVLSLAQIERSRFGLANIPGKTLMVSTENPSDYLGSTWVLNAIISGEKIPIEQKYKEGYDIIPRCKLLFAMNELPRISDSNNGLFRRIKIVKFPAIPEDKRDPKLKEDIKTESAGILNWMLDGLDRLRSRGRFEIPQSIKDATENYKNTNDIPKQFLEDFCYLDKAHEPKPGTVDKPLFALTATQLYQSYTFWCSLTGHKPMSLTRLAGEWERLGLENYKPSNVSTYKWIALKSDPEAQIRIQAQQTQP